tara:strand:+ start:1740 stop:2465 length:726 start_codon:yes stop_codon:yes gene_type:complete
MNNNKIGFIMLRNVNSSLQNLYWIKCYECIRRFYNATDFKIVIIDDSSDYKYIKYNNKLKNTIIIKSEFKKRGELLPYYYFLKYKYFDIAVIIHDSVFFNKRINFRTLNYNFLWEFNDTSKKNAKNKLESMINLYEDENLNKFYKLDEWKGCFGCMMTVNYDFLKTVNQKYNLEILIPHIKDRSDRMLFERLIAILFQISIIDKKKISILGNIHKYCRWGIKFNQKDNFTHLPIIKVWSGR